MLRTYLIQLLFFLLHGKLAPLGPLFPPLSLFLGFFLIRDPKTPLPTRSGLQQEEREHEGPWQTLRCWKIPSGLKEPFRKGSVDLSPRQGWAPNSTRDTATPGLYAHEDLCSELSQGSLSVHSPLNHANHCCSPPRLSPDCNLCPPREKPVKATQVCGGPNLGGGTKELPGQGTSKLCAPHECLQLSDSSSAGAARKADLH